MKFLEIGKKFLWFYARMEDVLVGLFMTSVIFISVGQILCRWLHINGMVWSDGFMRYSVLWIAMLGAAIATRESQHITVEIPSLFIKGRWINLYKGLVSTIATLVSVLLLIASWNYWHEEMEMEQMAFASVSTGMAISIMPYCFTIISLRFLLHTIHHFRVFINPALNPENQVNLQEGQNMQGVNS